MLDMTSIGMTNTIIRLVHHPTMTVRGSAFEKQKTQKKDASRNGYVPLLPATITYSDVSFQLPYRWNMANEKARPETANTEKATNVCGGCDPAGASVTLLISNQPCKSDRAPLPHLSFMR